jgi:hypothetical protein
LLLVPAAPACWFDVGFASEVDAAAPAVGWAGAPLEHALTKTANNTAKLTNFRERRTTSRPPEAFADL